MDNFDYSQYYYRPVHIRTGYASSDDDIINNAKGYVEADSPIIEFSSLQNVGSWLFLGDEIKVLSIPKDAEIISNKPMGQGGCYQYSTNKATVIETISVLEFLNRAKEAKINVVHVKKLDFPSGFLFPQQVDFFIFDQCAFKQNPHFSEKLRTFKLWDCNISGEFELPNSLDELEINNETMLPFSGSSDFIFPHLVKSSLMLGFVQIKSPLDMSKYSCEYMSFSYCEFKQPVILPKTPQVKDENTKSRVIVFDNCYGVDENLVIPDDFIGGTKFLFSNTTIGNSLIYRLKNELNCTVNITK